MAKKKAYGKSNGQSQIKSIADAQAKTSVQPNQSVEEDPLTRLLRHYLYGVQDMDTRRVRKNGWNDLINAYMGKLPVNWPYNSLITEPIIRTTILEKTSRLLNAKLQGRLVPRDENGDYVKAKINNALLSFQWDFATEGGAMVEKIASVDQYTRVFGAGFVLNYWNAIKNTNEVKILDPRDVFFDGSATHVRNARWVQVREWTTFDKLEERGYDVSEAREMAENGEITSQLRSTRYESIVKANRGLVDRVGWVDDLKNPVVEVVTEWGIDRNQTPYCTIFLPFYSLIISDLSGKDYPYKHGKIPVNMLRYYPLVDDIYGESECEPVLPLARAINAIWCGFVDECNLKLRPPLKIAAQGVRIETIEYGPAAKWIMNDTSTGVQEFAGGDGFIASFNTVYPALKAAFNTAMGDQSLGVAQGGSGKPGFDEKTATEVVSLEKQQNVRDQYNQLYLGEFLKDVMMMWLENNKQFLFDDPTKKTHILKIVGKSNIQEFQQMQLDSMEVPPYALKQISQTVMEHPKAVSDQMLQGIMSDVSVPKNPVVENPNEDNPENYKVHPKLEVGENDQEATLWITPEDFEGEYDYVPDVKSMQAGAGLMAQQARQQAYSMILSNQEVMQQLQMQGDSIKVKELLINILEDAGEKDAEALFEPIQNGQPGTPGQPNPAGQSAPGAGQPTNGPMPPSGVQQPPQAVPNPTINGGIPQAAGFPQ